MRHGLTLGELGAWFIDRFKLDVDYRVIEMADWQPGRSPGFGWPTERVWINPSPNAANLNMARAYAGTVMLEGTTLSEGRGTTRPLELFGAPDIEAGKVIAEMHAFAPGWLEGCKLREIWFEPTFHKHVGKLCSGVFIHAEGPFYDHTYFKPWRLQALGFKAIRRLYPDYDLWRDFPYEYEFDKLAIDVINGSPLLREWVDDANATPDDLDAITMPDEQTGKNRGVSLYLIDLSGRASRPSAERDASSGMCVGSEQGLGQVTFRDQMPLGYARDCLLFDPIALMRYRFGDVQRVWRCRRLAPVV